MPEVLDYLYACSLFYDKAERIWHERGVFYLANRLDMRDFIMEVKRRSGYVWHEGLLKYAEFVYLKVILAVCTQ